MNDHESPFDRLAAIAAAVLDAPMAFVTTFKDGQASFRSMWGGQFSDCRQEDSFCTHAMDLGAGAILVVENALADPVFASKPGVLAPAGVRFYAGSVITRHDGGHDGAVCVIDTRPRPRPTESQLGILKQLAALAAEQIAATEAHRAGQEQLAKLKMTESMSGIGHWRLDLEAMTPIWSDEVYRIHGVTRDTFNPAFGDGVAFYHPDDRATVVEQLQSTIATGQPYRFVLRLIRADGEERFVESRGEAERDASGRVVALIGLFQDITDTRRAHDRLAESEARYRLLAENSTDVIAEIGMDGRYLFVSEACVTVLGRSPESLVGRSTLEFIHPDDKRGLAAVISELVAHGRGRLDHPLRYRAITADGRWLWMEAHPTLVFDAQGVPSHYVDVIRDITYRKAIEAALEAAVAEAEAASVAKAEFLANMSHELRTPLTAIIGFAGLLKQYGTLGEQDRRFVDRISACADTLLAMVGDVLDYSKLEAGAVELHLEPVAVGPLLQETLAMVGPAAAEKWLALSVQIHGLRDPVLTADRTRLRQILMNLLSNAVKFTASGSVTVTAESLGDERVQFSVTDTGVGVPEDRRDRMFRRFSQADGSTVRDYGGSGLGLAICKALVEAMGGEIGFSSVAGEESTFWFRIPARRVEAVKAAA